ncbi:MAG: ATP synthase F0 subunit B [Candidatus Eremiobacteraeota bacterium]|nr:ATP synthase F0 subunit B [Candidatus Eremiobacteraeota bacterium]
MFLSVDGTLVVQLINFAIFFGILNLIFLRPVGRAIRERREYINSLTNDYDRYQAEAASLRAQAESVRGAARREAEALLSKRRAETSNETAEISGTYAQQATQTVEAAHETVTGELQAARANEAATVRDLAHLMVERTMTGAAQ